VPILLTAVKGKIRIKNRSILNEYGASFAVKQTPFKQSNYIEWQIGYDVVKKEISEAKPTTLPDKNFIGANRKEKAFYELSEYIWYFYKWNILTKTDLENVKNYLNKISDDRLLDVNSELQIERSHLIEKEIDNFKFEYTQVKYPLLIHKFGNYEIITEIKITEKQQAVGVQPMLYLCFPITELKAAKNLIGRVAETKEIAYFEITKDNIKVFSEVLKMFGILSRNHKYDILQIIGIILA
jgi:uncharacterized ubiquitin-like protein YukD